MTEWINSIKAQFVLNFIEGDRWKLLASGLGVTLKITLIAMVLGIVIGVILATIRSTYDLTKDDGRGGFGRVLLKIFNVIAKIYLTIIRGTPVVIQLLIIYFVIFASSDNGVLIAALAFGMNSGAYVAEIVRGGLNSVDKGQFEAGRSLGFGYIATMWYIILPQAFKNILPALGNEAIMLLKDTSISGYVAIQDLTKGGDIIRSRTYDAFMPLIAVALIYLILVTILTLLLRRLERRLQSSER